jgi:metal-dependent hydrolase (beta-lactamase superfamily II)
VGPKPVNDPGIAFADLPPIDVVLVSHGHYDHLDLTTLSRLAAVYHPRVVTPLGNDTIMRNHDSQPKLMTGRIKLISARESLRRWLLRDTGRRETYLTEICHSGLRLLSMRQADASIS